VLREIGAALVPRRDRHRAASYATPIRRGRQARGSEGESLEEKTDPIAPGESADLTVDLEDGEYEIYCPIGDHKDRGMEGDDDDG